MTGQQRELEALKKILQNSSKGLTITELSLKSGMNRNSVAKYANMLWMSGQADMKTFGRSKIYSLSNRITLATALSLSSELIVLIDEDLNVIEANDSFIKYTGMAKDAIVGQNLANISAPLLTHREILLNIKDVLWGRELTREISTGNESNYFKIKMVPVAVNDSKRKAAIVFEDITHRKQVEIALKESESRYRAVVEDQSELVCRIREDTTLLFVNKALCRFFNINRSDLLGKRIIDIIHYDKLGNFQALLKKACKEKSGSVEHSVTSIDGQVRWLQWINRSIPCEGGRITEFQLVGREITERKRAEEALRKSETHLARSQEVAHLGSFEWDSVEGNCEWSDEMFRIIGVMPGDIKPSHEAFMDRIHPEDRAEMMEHASYLFKEQAETGLEVRIVRPDGTIRWTRLEWQAQVNKAGKPVRLYGTIQDITERKQAEQELMLAQLSIDRAADGILWINPTGNITYANDAACRVLQYTRTELETMHVWDLGPLYTREQWEEHWQEIKERGSFTFETLHRAKNGRTFPVEVSRNYVRSGEREFNFAYIKDISEREDDEIALQKAHDEIEDKIKV